MLRRLGKWTETSAWSVRLTAWPEETALHRRRASARRAENSRFFDRHWSQNRLILRERTHELEQEYRGPAAPPSGQGARGGLFLERDREPRGDRAGAGRQAGAVTGREVDLPDRRAGAGRRPTGHARHPDRRKLDGPDRQGQRSRLRRGRDRPPPAQREPGDARNKASRFDGRVWPSGADRE